MKKYITNGSPMPQLFLPFLISLLIGLFIGIERERSHPPGSQAMGVRTFLLIALLGTLSATVSQPLLTLTTSLFVFTVIVLSYHSTSKRVQKQMMGITTEMAAAVVYFLGYLTPEQPLLTAIIGIIVLLALIARASLHSFSRDKLKTKEIYATITILVIGLGVLPFLPDHTIDPWQIFNPRQYMLLVLVLSIIQFSGYIAIRIFGHRIGVLLTGFFSGLISSTSTFLILSRLSRAPNQPIITLIASGALATNAMLFEAILLIALISPLLLMKLIIPIITMLLVGFLSIWPVIKAKHSHTNTTLLTNPLNFIAILKLATLLASMLAIVAIVKQHMGAAGVHYISFIGGLFELHSVTIANASLFTHGGLSLTNTVQSIALAIVASYIAKFVLLASVARNRFALWMSSYLAAMVLIGTTLFLWLPISF